MTALLAALLLASAGPLFEEAVMPAADVSVSASATTARLWWGPPQPEAGLPDGLAGWTARGCATMEGLLLPVRHLYVAVPHGSDVELSASPLGARSLDLRGGSVAGIALDVDDRDSLFASSSLPRRWAELVEVADYRGIRLARIDVHPVVSSGFELEAARGVELAVEYSGGRPRPASGSQGDFYGEVLLGGNLVWERRDRPERDDSPFWGMPWVEVELDTTGVYSITGEELPQAVGQASNGLAMYRGRGRMMGPDPWNEAYQPIPVPLIVEDGGDGIFDEADRIVFFGTGLSWWEPDGEVYPQHYMSRWDSLNSHWLTWGGGDGARMDTLNGGLTGAPAMPDSFPARVHLEEEHYWVSHDAPSGWTWFKVYGSTPETLEAQIPAPGASGSGLLRIGFLNVYTKDDGGEGSSRATVGAEVYLNGEMVADTSFYSTSSFQLDVQAAEFVPGANQLQVKIWRESGTREPFIDWMEAFPWSNYHDSGQLCVPLEWYGEEGRRRFDWQGDLFDAYVLFVEEDSTASLVSTSDASSFELDVGDLRQSRSVWITSRADLMSPASVESRSPGRIVGTLDGAERLFVCHEDFYEGSQALAEPGVPTAFVTTREIFQEFNGGVRDPEAIRAFLQWAVDQWDPAPLDVVLVGSGSYDVRGFGTDEECYIAAAYPASKPSYPLDDYYGTLEGSSVPQLALSRICVLSGQELGTIVEKSLAYRGGEASGDWQSRVIGAADDERYPNGPVYNQWYHTIDMEDVLQNSLYGRYRPVKCYEIFFDWNQQWRKPEARQDLIDQWSSGAVFVGFLGHGAHDQICDEGLLFLDDADLLQCGDRLNYSFFGSCDVGEFYKPDRGCISQAVVAVPGGGSVVSSGAVAGTIRTDNRDLLAAQLQLMLSPSPMTFSSCLLAAKLEAGYGTFTRQYILFGDGTITPEVPDTALEAEIAPMLTGETSVLEGEAFGAGPVSVVAFESAQPDTYVTMETNYPIPYLTPYRFRGYLPGVASAQAFYNGSVPPGMLELEMFVPVDADTGRNARVELFQATSDGGAIAALYPESIGVGTVSGSDSLGPEADIWIRGFRRVDHPSVSGEVVLEAELFDSSGINLLAEPGRQLTLYVDDDPQYVAGNFTYDPGSSTSGRLEVELGGLSEGEHQLRLRAADGVNNISYEEMALTVLDDEGGLLYDVFAYPNPCGDGTSINWMQSGSGPVSLEVYTASGRRVYSRSGISGAPGYNQIWWDCRDTDGDPVASGSYIYRLAAGGSGTEGEFTGIVAVVR